MPPEDRSSGRPTGPAARAGSDRPGRRRRRAPPRRRPRQRPDRTRRAVPPPPECDRARSCARSQAPPQPGRRLRDKSRTPRKMCLGRGQPVRVGNAWTTTWRKGQLYANPDTSSRSGSSIRALDDSRTEWFAGGADRPTWVPMRPGAAELPQAGASRQMPARRPAHPVSAAQPAIRRQSGSAPAPSHRRRAGPSPARPP